MNIRPRLSGYVWFIGTDRRFGKSVEKLGSPSRKLLDSAHTAEAGYLSIYHLADW